MGIPPPRSEAVAANGEGFLALLLIVLFLGFICSLMAVTGDFLFESIVLLLLDSGSWLFALSGARRGVGASKVAAIVSSTLLIASVVLVLAAFVRSL